MCMSLEYSSTELWHKKLGCYNGPKTHELHNFIIAILLLGDNLLEMELQAERMRPPKQGCGGAEDQTSQPVRAYRYHHVLHALGNPTNHGSKS